MPLPDTIRVKLSSEAAEYISLTPVVVQEMPVRELVEHMLAITGKDETRIRDLLLRGALVSGASRFRWSGMDADAGSLQALLASFPDPDPSRPFAAARCVRAVLRGPRQPIGIPREIGMRRGFLDRIFGRASFWDLLMGIAASGDHGYGGYFFLAAAENYLRALVVPEDQRPRTTSPIGAVTLPQPQSPDTP